MPRVVVDESHDHLVADLGEYKGAAVVAGVQRAQPAPDAVVAGHDARVVVEDVELSETVDGRVDHPLRVELLGDVGVNVHCSVAGGGRGLLSGVVVHVGEDDPRTLAREQLRGRSTEPVRTAGDDRSLSLQASRHARKSDRGNLGGVPCPFVRADPASQHVSVVDVGDEVGRRDRRLTSLAPRVHS